MVSNNTPLVGMIGIVSVVALIGAIAGLGLADTDLLNYNRSAADARAQDQKTEEQAQKAAVDLGVYEAQSAAQIERIASDLVNYKAVQEAAAQAEQEEMRLVVEARRRQLEQDLELAHLTRQVALGAGTVAALIVSTGLAIFLIQCGRSRVVSTQTKGVQMNLWQTPAWRAEQIRRARERERRERRVALSQQTIEQSISGGNGQHPPESKEPEDAIEQVV
jgi:hypothetical protein